MFHQPKWAVIVGAGAALTAPFWIGSPARAANITSFTAGDLVVLRGGDATNSQTTEASGEVPVYLDEYSVSINGTTATTNYVGSYAIPSGTLTLPGMTASSHEGSYNRKLWMT